MEGLDAVLVFVWAIVVLMGLHAAASQLFGPLLSAELAQIVTQSIGFIFMGLSWWRLSRAVQVGRPWLVAVVYYAISWTCFFVFRKPQTVDAFKAILFDSTIASLVLLAMWGGLKRIRNEWLKYNKQNAK